MVSTRRRFTARPALPLLIGLIALAACRGSSTPPPSDSRPQGGELVASLRSEPGNYNRMFEPSAAAELVSLLAHARLVRVNRTTDNVEPGLAESWESSPDGASVTLKLRPGVTFSDGTPFTSADVLFSFEVAYSDASVVGDSLKVSGQPLHATAPNPQTVVIKFPGPFSAGVRILENMPVLPRHRLEGALRAGTIAKAWTPATPLTDIAGLGPFVLTEHVAGQRLVFSRNTRYWRRGQGDVQLPLLDKLTVQIVPDQNAEALRLESGGIDLMSNGDIRPDDHARFKRLADQGRLRLVDAGVGLDPNLLWFNLKPRTGKPAKAWLHKKEFRQALSYAADRDAIANVVYLGAAVPIYGPVTPRNATWYSPNGPVYRHDQNKARELLTAAGVTDRNGDGTLEDASGGPVRFSMLVQAGHTVRERTAALLQEQFRRVGVAVDIVPLDTPSLFKRWQSNDYDSIFHGFQASATDPAMNLDFWVSAGVSHFWNPQQSTPGTAWERTVDELMRQQLTARDLPERQRLFAEVQRIFGEELPALYFVAPKVTLALSPRVVNESPAPQIPQLLWSADTLGQRR